MLQGEQCHRTPKKGLFTKLPLRDEQGGQDPSLSFGAALSLPLQDISGDLALAPKLEDTA